MIQDMNQLKFVYEALLRYVQSHLTKRKFPIQHPLHSHSVVLPGGALNVSSMNNQQPANATPKPSPPNTNTVLLANEMQTIMEKAKPAAPSGPNYDVGPILSSTSPPASMEEKPPTKQLTPIEANFNLRPEESHVKPKTTREDFFRAKPAALQDLSDPFNQLDPLWTFR